MEDNSVRPFVQCVWKNGRARTHTHVVVAMAVDGARVFEMLVQVVHEFKYVAIVRARHAEIIDDRN